MAKWITVVSCLALICKLLIFDYSSASVFQVLLLVGSSLFAFIELFLVLGLSKPAVTPVDEEDPSQPKASLSIFQLFRILKPYFWPQGWYNRARVAMTWIVLGGSKAANIVGPLFLALTIDALTLGDRDQAIFYIVVYCGLGFGSLLCKQLQTIIYLGVKQIAFVEIAELTFRHLHSLSLEWHLKKKMGNVLRSMDRGVSSADTLVTYLFLYLAPSLAECVVTFIIFFVHFNQPALSAIAFFGLMAYTIATVQITIARNKTRALTNKHDNDYHDKATDSLINYETVKYFANEDFECARYKDSLTKYQTYSITTQVSLGFLNVVQELIVRSSLCAVLIVSAYQVVREDGFGIGDFVAVNSYMLQLYSPLSFLGSIYGAIVQAFVDMTNLSELLAVDPDVSDAPGAPELRLTNPKKGVSVEFRNVRFKYPGQEINQGLKDISFTVAPGTTCALVGHTGSGKTSIARLLFRFYDCTSGQVLVDGQDISKVQQKSLRRQIGVVPQDTVLFNESILFNLKYGKLGATMEEVEEACRSAQIIDFIDRLPEKWESKVGERGLKLSGGEKQRVAIARALLKNPPLVLLDEATSALDSVTEKSVQASLNRLGENRTTLIIAHRLSTIRNADQIIVLRAGRIIEKGTHNELIALGGEYKSMWEAQQRQDDNVAAVAHSELEEKGHSAVVV